MTTVSSTGTKNTQIQTTALNTTNNQSNIYTAMFAPSMANDYFGSQAFGSGSLYTNNIVTNADTQSAVSQKPVEKDIMAEIPNIFESAPDDIASALLQQHAIETNPALQQLFEKAVYEQNKTETAQTSAVKEQAPVSVSAPANTTTMPTMEDYYIANQIANQFANSAPLISPYDSYFQRDFFANQSINPQTNMSNSQTQTANKISYAA